MIRLPAVPRPLVFLFLAACFHKKLADGVRGNPNDDEAWGDAGDAEAAAGNTAQALTDYLRALAIDPRDSEWQRKVGELGGEELFRSSIDGLLPYTPGDDELLGDRGDAFATAGFMGEACALYGEAQTVDPQDTEWLGKVQTCATPIAEEGPYGDAVENSGVLRVLGYQDGVEGGVEGGVIGYSEGYPYTEGYPYGDVTVGDPAAVAASLEHARAGHKPEARNALWVALQADPNATDLRAMWTMLTGETSLVLLQKLADASAEDPAVWGALGDAKLVAGKRAEAITAWQKAAALAPYDLAWSNRLEMAKNTVVK